MVVGGFYLDKLSAQSKCLASAKLRIGSEYFRIKKFRALCFKAGLHMQSIRADLARRFHDGCGEIG